MPAAAADAAHLQDQPLRVAQIVHRRQRSRMQIEEQAATAHDPMRVRVEQHPGASRRVRRERAQPDQEILQEHVATIVLRIQMRLAEVDRLARRPLE